MSSSDPSTTPNRRRRFLVLTGASSGLGLTLARRLMQREDYHLVLTARESSLSRLARKGIVENENLWIRPLDVTDSQQRRALVDELESGEGGIAVLINNAGIAYRSVVEHVTEEEHVVQMAINFSSPMELTRLVLPGMRRRRSGRIINVSSVGGMMAMPTMAIYSASKFALEGFTEALWYEVRPWNIKVTLIEPGFIRSDSFRNTQYTSLSRKAFEDEADPYHPHYRHMVCFIEKLMRRSSATPNKVVEQIIRTLVADNPPLRVFATLDAHGFALLRRFLPRHWYHAILYRNLPHIREWGREGPDLKN